MSKLLDTKSSDHHAMLRLTFNRCPKPQREPNGFANNARQIRRATLPGTHEPALATVDAAVDKDFCALTHQMARNPTHYECVGLVLVARRQMIALVCTNAPVCDHQLSMIVSPSDGFR
ncbi:hypothetical protein ACTMSW_18810 [Micromonospora sp. BQ11]|uniref:hypothetical protein n=1 Tax=Micromonospora sp. BQ11 TaxID=3452212 RepID=UPI003F899FBA